MTALLQFESPQVLLAANNVLHPRCQRHMEVIQSSPPGLTKLPGLHNLTVQLQQISSILMPVHAPSSKLVACCHIPGLSVVLWHEYVRRLSMSER